MKKLAVAVTISTCLVGLIIAGFARLGDAAVIYGCVAKIVGNLRIVSGPDQCRPNETPISWNSAGQQGPQGAPGTSFDLSRLYVHTEYDSYLSDCTNPGDVALSCAPVCLSTQWVRDVYLRPFGFDWDNLTPYSYADNEPGECAAICVRNDMYEFAPSQLSTLCMPRD